MVILRKQWQSRRIGLAEHDSPMQKTRLPGGRRSSGLLLAAGLGLLLFALGRASRDLIGARQLDWRGTHAAIGITSSDEHRALLAGNGQHCQRPRKAQIGIVESSGRWTSNEPEECTESVESVNQTAHLLTGRSQQQQGKHICRNCCSPDAQTSEITVRAPRFKSLQLLPQIQRSSKHNTAKRPVVTP
jgi:hypothetical protein